MEERDAQISDYVADTASGLIDDIGSQDATSISDGNSSCAHAIHIHTSGKEKLNLQNG